MDFKALAAETRQKTGASFSKGQALGKSRAGADKGKALARKMPAERKSGGHRKGDDDGHRCLPSIIRGSV